MASKVERTSLDAAVPLLYGTAINMVTVLQMRFATSLLSRLTAACSDSYQRDQSSNPTEQFQFSTRIQHRRDDDAAGHVHEDLSEDTPTAALSHYLCMWLRPQHLFECM